MKTVDELMALADACIDAAHQEAAFTERYDARAALLTALQESVQSADKLTNENKLLRNLLIELIDMVYHLIGGKDLYIRKPENES